MVRRFIIRIGKFNFDLFIIDQYVALNGRAIDDTGLQQNESNRQFTKFIINAGKCLDTSM